MCPRGRGKGKTEAVECKGRVQQTSFLDGMLKKKKSAPQPVSAPTSRLAPLRATTSAPKASTTSVPKPRAPTPAQQQLLQPVRTAPTMTLAQQREMKEQQLKARMGIGATTPAEGGIPGAEFVPQKTRRRVRNSSKAAVSATQLSVIHCMNQDAVTSSTCGQLAAGGSGTVRHGQMGCDDQESQSDPFANMRMWVSNLIGQASSSALSQAP